LELNYILGSVQSFVSLLSVEYDTSFRASFYLPFGKADDTPSPALARVRSSYSFTLDALDLGHPRLSLN
jgi:hypothetical protein